jgi:hypothetical protein
MVNLPDPYQVLCEKIIAAINEFEVATGRAIGDIGLRPEESDVCRTRVCRELIIDVLPKAGDPIR